jgi:hypothetical protein
VVQLPLAKLLVLVQLAPEGSRNRRIWLSLGMAPKVAGGLEIKKNSDRSASLLLAPGELPNQSGPLGNATTLKEGGGNSGLELERRGGVEREFEKRSPHVRIVPTGALAVPQLPEMLERVRNELIERWGNWIWLGS